MQLLFIYTGFTHRSKRHLEQKHNLRKMAKPYSPLFPPRKQNKKKQNSTWLCNNNSTNLIEDMVKASLREDEQQKQQKKVSPFSERDESKET